MTKRSTKRALILSGLSLLICVSMLMGSTFAWFTDGVTSANNKIQSGTLEIDLELFENGSWTSIKESGDPIFNYNNWEPGYTDATLLKIVNKGTLGLKWYAKFVANGGKFTALADVIDVYVNISTTEFSANRNLDGYTKVGTVSDLVNTFGIATNGILYPAGSTGATAYLGIALKMQETAGSDYEGLSLVEGAEGFDIQIFATQLAYEEDSIDDKYDVDAEYFVPVSNAAELANALENGKDVILAADVAVTEVMTVKGDVTIDLNGKTFDASGMTGADLGRPIQLSEGANLTVNAGDSVIKLGGHGFINVLDTTDTANITINGGNFVGETQNGTLIRLRNVNENVNIVLNDVNYVDNSNNGYIVSTQGFEYTGEGTLTVNGGSYSANYGFQIYGLTATLTDVEIKTNGTAVEASGNNTYGLANVTLNNCDITVATGVQVVNAPAAGVAASYGGTLTIKNSTISGNMGAVYHVYNSGGTIIAENNDVANASFKKALCKNDGIGSGITSAIVIDGNVQ